jgi:chemotaxis-related protein WspD
VPSPPGYLEEWTERLAAPLEEAARDLRSVLVFRLCEEWLALPVQVVVEVATVRPVHRVPHRGGLLAGLVNIRGELHLCAHLGRLLGVDQAEPAERPALLAHGRAPAPRLPHAGRLVVVRRDSESWVFPVDEVEKVHRFPWAELVPAPATVSRSVRHLTRGTFVWQERPVGLLDEGRLFEALRERLR